jgi:hypothetical protein
MTLRAAARRRACPTGRSHHGQGACPIEAVKGANYNLAVTELMLVAIDWSGRSDDGGRTTWMAVIEDGVFRVLENGRSRPEVRKELIRLRRR